MSSGSFKELLKVVNAYIPTVFLPLPDDLLHVIQAYLDKHHPIEESDSQRLHDELLNTYQREVKNNPNRYAVFLAILRNLRPALMGSARVMQWWEIVLEPMLEHLAEEKSLVFEYRGMLLDILVYDVDDEKKSYDANASALLSEKLLDVWLKNSDVASVGASSTAPYTEEQVRSVLIEFGKKRPKDFLTALDKFFVKKDHRVQILSLLVEFVRYGPPHLHQLLATPLFKNLLRCLEIDTSTTVVSLALTALTMLLPHIPNDIDAHLPSLFNIYCRVLFWDRERGLHALSPEEQSNHADPEKHPAYAEASVEDTEWEKLSYSPDTDDETVPNVLHYFTFLYGLYPINFMSYIRKPERYLRHANFDGRDDAIVQPSEIRQRSEPFREAHLLHPNFYTMTIESELSDLNRWMNSEASDVVASCMALYRPFQQESIRHPRLTSAGGLPEIRNTVVLNGEPINRPLLAGNDEGMDDFRRVSSIAPNASWRNTTSTIVNSPSDSRRQSSAERKPSQSTSMPIADSPTLGPLDMQSDSPTLPPQLLLTDANDEHQRTSMFAGGLQQSLPNESEISIVSSQYREPSITDSYLQSMEKHQALRSPSLHTSPTEAGLDIASLRRELLLLKNELDFERYLKQQHLSHIGQLRGKHVEQARVEAETQNLINSNKILKSKLDEAKNTAIQMKKESEKSRLQAKKWEAELTTKLRALREEQRKWNVETETLRRDLESSQTSNDEYRRLIVNREAGALASRQKVESIEGNVGEIERLRAEVDKLTGLMRTYEAKEIQIERAKASEGLALTKVEILEMRLKARENELEIVKRTADRDVNALKTELEEARMDMQDQTPPNFQVMLDNALQISRLRLLEAQKAHGHLLMRFNKLNSQYLALKDHRSPDEPLLSGGDDSHYEFGSSYPSGSSPSIRRTIRRRGLSDPDLGDRISHNFGSPSDDSGGYFPIRPARMDTMSSGPRPSSQDGIRVPSKGLQGSIALGHIRSGSADSAAAGNGLNLTATGQSLDASGKPKIKPSSDIRVYGRGGVQNVGTTPKPKKDKKKEDPDKKDKKTGGLRGIRGFT